MKKSAFEKDDMKELTDKRVRELLEANPADIDTDTFRNMLDQAKIGMVYIRDREMMKRIQQGQIIRVVSFISQDTEERKRYIEISMPQLVPQIEQKP
jgi:hypothetical protein